MGDPSTLDRYYSTVVVQPGTYCNLDCDYCYLPGRKSRNLMVPEIAEKIADDIARQLAGPDSPDCITVLWHCAEPLTTPKEHFLKLLEPFASLQREGRIRHQMQSNATLIDDDWIRIFLDHHIGVHVSLDGPHEMNRHRKNWGGRAAHQQIMAGVHRLRAAGLTPNAIAVVTPETIGRGRELVGFFVTEGFTRLALNIEQREGANTARPLIGQAEARVFWRDVMRYLHETQANIQVRELGYVAGFIKDVPSPRRDPIPTVMWNGDVVLGGPELAGVKNTQYQDFISGNVLNEPIQSMLIRRHRIHHVAEFERGLALCRETCPFWGACEGGFAPNRLAEHGRFDVSVTSHCQVSRQAPLRAALDLADPVKDAELISKLHTIFPPEDEKEAV